MKFIVFHLETDSIGCSDTICYKANEDCFTNDEELNEEYLCEYGYELAKDNADMYGLLNNEDDSGIEGEHFYETHELVEFDSVEDAENEYGEVQEF